MVLELKPFQIFVDLGGSPCQTLIKLCFFNGKNNKNILHIVSDIALNLWLSDMMLLSVLSVTKRKICI